MKKILVGTCMILGLLLCGSCENEPIGGTNVNTDSFQTDSELYDLVQRISEENGAETIQCIDFNYPFALFIFDADGNYLEPTSIANDEQFSALLGSLQDGYALSISYPIMGTLHSGEIIEINDNEELKLVIDSCTMEAAEGRCTSHVTDCDHVIAAFPAVPNDFESDRLTFNMDGFVQLHHGTEIYFGSWFTLHIGAELHINVNFDTEEVEITNFWNEDWLVLSLEDTRLEISAGAKRLQIDKDCDLDCNALIFEVCEEPATPGIGIFQLDNYSVCTIIPLAHEGSNALNLTYFETELDAQNKENEISPIDYQNSINPQTIFVRIEVLETDQLLGYHQFNIQAIYCD